MQKLYVLIILTLLVVPISCQQKLQLNEDQTSSLLMDDNFTSQVLEMEIDEMVLDLSKRLKPSSLLFKNVNLLDMESELVQSGMDVLVVDGSIAKIQSTGKIELSAADKVIDGTGKYLMPGLTDSHVHIGTSNSEKLLNILTGVTTVRDMCGFDWMIDYAKRIESNSILAPNTYVAGNMLNYFSLGVYSTVVKTEEEAQQAVRRQKELGYDFIKVWNNMPLPILRAIAEESRKLDIDLIGHVPHNVSMQDALSLGYKVQEHFKGIILDNKLELTTEDYQNVLANYRGEEFWLSPTFALHTQALRGEPALKRLNSHPAYQFISALTKSSWLQNAENYEFGRYGNIPDSIYSMQREIFGKIYPVFKNFIAGTDNNGANPNMVAGFSLQDELMAFRRLGLSNYEVLRTATINPSKAMNKEMEYGSVAIGKRADLLLLSKNPLESLENLFEPNGVMIRGIWISAEENQQLRKQLADIYQQSGETLSEEVESKIESLIRHYLREDMGYLIQPLNMIEFASTLEALNLLDDAQQILQRCAERYPYYYSFDALGKHYQEYQKDPKSAMEYYQKSLSLYPNGDTARKAVDSIN